MAQRLAYQTSDLGVAGSSEYKITILEIGNNNTLTYIISQLTK